MEAERILYSRIKYPDDCLPELLIIQKEGETKKCRVTDISENGMGLIGEELRGLEPQSRLNAQIIFSDGQPLDVEGEVLRVNENTVGVYLTKGIPATRIKKEWELLSD